MTWNSYAIKNILTALPFTIAARDCHDRTHPLPV